MATKPVIFKSGKEQYHADTCRPVVAAMQAGTLVMKSISHGAYPGFRLSERVMPELRSVGFWNVPRQQNWGLEWHRNEGLELVFIESGRLGFAVGKTEHVLRPGDMTITRPWQQHRLGLPHIDACRMIWLIIDVGVRRPHQSWKWPKWLVLTRDERDRLNTLLRHNEQPVWKTDANIAACFGRIAKLVDQAEKKFDRTRMALAINELLLAICETLENRDIPLDDSLASTRRSVELFLAELHRHVDEPWTVESMAQQCGLKRSRFTSYCREITNMSPSQYLLHCRVEVAAQLLRQEPDQSITDIAFNCGFCSSQYFATTFRRLLGQSPRDWREETAKR